MPFTPLTKDQLRQLLAVVYADKATDPALDIPGEPLDALWNATTTAALKIQDLITYCDRVSRLATIPPNADGSPSPDAISFVKPWGIAPIPGGPSSGGVVYSIPSIAAVDIPIRAGTLLRTGPGSPQLAFVQLADATIPAGQLSSPPVTVQCTASGRATCIQPGAITQFISGPGGAAAPAGLTVTNPLAFNNGTDIESQAALVARFTKQTSTGSAGTNYAIASRLLSIATGITYSIGDRINADGSAHAAYFCVALAIQGAVAPTDSALLATARAQLMGDPVNGVAPVRAVGISFDVVSPAIVPVSVAASISVLTGYAAADVQAACVAAVGAFVASIGLDPLGASTTISYFRIAAVLYGVPGVKFVESLTLNGGTVDIVAGFASLFSAGTCTFTMV